MQQLHWQGADTMSMPWNGFYVLQPSPFINPFNMQQLHWQPDTMSMPWNGFHIEPIPPGPIYQGMAQQHEAPSWGPHHNQQERPHQAEPQYTPQRHEHQYQSPSSGPSRNQRRRFRQAEPQYKSHTHESYGPVVEDRSTGFNPGHAWVNASKNTGDGKVRRTPSQNPIIADLQLNTEETQKVGIKPLSIPNSNRLCGISKYVVFTIHPISTI